MIRQLTGRVATLLQQSIVIDVRGVGYLVYTPLPTTWEAGAEATLHTYLAVRETALDLYGFATESELELFTLLLDVPKIGPKSALHIMSQATPGLLIESIGANDAARLHKLSGVGKKTAENVVQHLHTKLDGLSPTHAAHTTVAASTQKTDAIDALVSLGYDMTSARNIVQQLDEGLTVNELITKALKELT